MSNERLVILLLGALAMTTLLGCFGLSAANRPVPEFAMDLLKGIVPAICMLLPSPIGKGVPEKQSP